MLLQAGRFRFIALLAAIDFSPDPSSAMSSKNFLHQRSDVAFPTLFLKFLPLLPIISLLLVGIFSRFEV